MMMNLMAVSAVNTTETVCVWWLRQQAFKPDCQGSNLDSTTY